MRFIKKFTVMFLFFVTLFTLTSCFEVAGATGIAVTKMPKSTYYVNEIQLNEIDLEVTIYYSTSSETFNYSKAIGKGVKFSGFDLSTPGNFTATVSFESFSTTFNYSVIEKESDFAGGNGTAINPYLVSTPDQFKKMVEKTQEDTSVHLYFKLLNSIDFKDVTITPVENSAFGIFTGTLDGDGYKISNIVSNLVTSIFGVIPSNINHETVIKNLVYENNVPMSLVKYAYSSIKFENVDVHGNISLNGQNFSQYISHVLGDGVTLTFNKCTNYLNYFGNSAYGSLFLGGYAYSSHVIFKDCINYGSIEGQSVGIFVGNYGAFVDNKGTVEFENCVNYGKATGIYTGLLNGYNGTMVQKEFTGITSAQGLLNDISVKTILEYNKDGNVIIDLDKEDVDKEAVKYIRVSMQFRTAEMSTNYTNRAFFVQDIEDPTDVVITSFKNWSVREAIKDNENQDKSFAVDVDSDDILSMDQLYKYITLGENSYYYFDSLDYYLKINEPDSFYFIAFLYDKDGKILYASNQLLMNLN